MRSLSSSHLVPRWLKGRKAGRTAWTPVTRTEKFLVVLASALFLTLLFADVVNTAPHDAAPLQVSFDVAPSAGWTTPAQEKFAADASAEGTRPDAIH